MFEWRENRIMPSLLSRSEKLPRRMFLALFLSSSALLLGHIVHGLVAQPLDISVPPLEPTESRAHGDAAPPITVSSRRLAEDILSSGLFPLPPDALATFSSGPGKAVARATPPPPPLNVWTKVRLLGVAMSGKGHERAVLEEAGSKTQTLYRIGQSVQNVGELAAIEPNRVLFRDGTQEEWLHLAFIPPGTSASPRLLGIVVSRDGAERAVFEEADGKTQALYRAGQPLQNLGELAAIEPNRVLFRKGTQEEWVNLAIIPPGTRAGPSPQAVPTTGPIASAPPTPFQTPPLSRSPLLRRSVDRAFFAELVSDPEMFVTEARLQAHVTTRGQIDGFRVDGLRRAGVLEKTGLQNDDILSRINGVELRNPELLWNMLKQLQNEQTIRLDVMRSSTPVTLVVDIRS